MHVTQLASGTINGADQLSIELREPDDAPATVWIIWPERESRCTHSPDWLRAGKTPSDATATSRWRWPMWVEGQAYTVIARAVTAPKTRY
jgi:hypothetical protein